MATDPQSSFVCACSNDSRSACQGEPFFKKHEGKRYCVLHYPAKDKIEAFRIALKRKMVAEDFDFQEVWFPEEANFNTKIFSTLADFGDATFTGFADFYEATFQEDGRFSGAKFNDEAHFYRAKFYGDAKFGGATFEGPARFDKAFFKANAKFKSATFKTTLRFFGAEKSKDLESQIGFSESTQLNFRFAYFEEPERVSFHNLKVRPHWFVDVDSRKFEFINVKFISDLKFELKSLKTDEITSPNVLLAIAYRRLADNAEFNHFYSLASHLRFSAFEVNRIVEFPEYFPWQKEWWQKLRQALKEWRQRPRQAVKVWWQRRKPIYKARAERAFIGFAPWRLEWWYWVASSYGERVDYALFVFVMLIGLFTCGYKSASFEPKCKPGIVANVDTKKTLKECDPEELPPRTLRWGEAALYSFNVAILQKPEPKPRGLWGGLLVALETVLGPAQAALLALALRRRFMR